MVSLPNDALRLTKPAQAMELRKQLIFVPL